MRNVKTLKRRKKHSWLSQPITDMEKVMCKFQALELGISPIDFKGSQKDLPRDARRKFRKLWRRSLDALRENCLLVRGETVNYHAYQETPGFARRRARERLVMDYLVAKSNAIHPFTSL